MSRWLLSVGFLALFCQAAVLFAADDDELSHFRIDNTLTIRHDDEVVTIKSSTIFSENRVFDFVGENGEFIIYDRQAERFSLIDPIHRIRTELLQSDIDQFMANINSRLTEEGDRFYMFMLHPEFSVARRDELGEMLFQSKWIDYSIETRRFEDERLVRDYFEFSDAYSLLNVYLNPGTLTPLARIKVNETLREEKRFPAKITLSVYPKGKWLFAKMIQYQSEHQLVRRLTESDRGKILRAVLFTEQFPKVTFGKYYKIANSVE